LIDEMNSQTYGLWIAAVAGALGVLSFWKQLQSTPKEHTDRRRSLMIGFVLTTFGFIAFVAILVRRSRHWLSSSP
jgi:uncharacterized BrkB/YihY/UPF0761 family membrane protein